MRRHGFVISAVVVLAAFGTWAPIASASAGSGTGRASDRAVRATPRWKSSGPLGGDVVDFANVPGHPGVVYAALAEGGLFRSIDGGAKWSHAGLANFDLADIAMSSSGTLFAASERPSRILRRVAGAHTWTGVNPGSDEFRTVAPSPSNPAIVYLAGDNGKTFRSIDGGKTWHQRGTTPSIAQGMTVDPDTPGTAYIAGQADSYVTTNGGATWKHLHVPSADDLRIAITPTDPQRIYVATGGGVFRSLDGGSTWKHLGAAKVTSADTVAFVPGHPKTLFAGGQGGVFRSLNGGKTWSQVLTPGVNGLDIQALDVLSSTAGLAGDLQFGTYRTGNGGTTWQHSNAGLAGVAVEQLAIGSSTTLLTSGSSHTFLSTDGGATWPVDPTAPQAAGSIVFDPSDVQTAYIGTFFDGVFRTVDGGAHWQNVDGNHGYVLGLAVEPTDTQSIDAGAGDEVRRSVNGGDTWNPTGSIGSQVHQIAFSNQPNPVTLAATSGGVFRSTNDGFAWHKRRQGAMSSVEFDPLHPKIAYAGGFGPLLVKSVDGGQTWSLSQTGLTPKHPVTSLVIDPVHPSTIYVGTQGGGVLRSVDSGGHWAPFNSGLFNKTVTSMAIDPVDGRTVYAGTSGDSVFVIHLP